MNPKWIAIVCGILLVLAIPNNLWPYGYYIFLRWAVLISSLAVANELHKSHITGLAIVFLAVAFLFNPIIPIYLNKDSWVPLDFISAILFFIAAYSLSRQTVKE